MNDQTHRPAGSAETQLHEARWRVDELAMDLIIAREQKHWSYDKERHHSAVKAALKAARSELAKLEAQFANGGAA